MTTASTSTTAPEAAAGGTALSVVSGTKSTAKATAINKNKNLPTCQNKCRQTSSSTAASAVIQVPSQLASLNAHDCCSCDAVHRPYSPARMVPLVSLPPEDLINPLLYLYSSH